MSDKHKAIKCELVVEIAMACSLGLAFLHGANMAWVVRVAQSFRTVLKTCLT